ncbi:adenylyl-sulfate kinase [Chromatiales bacterium (ex Bugula neritina AB1)]|nr:adenylyl-sulfate kinase [Chromatiales bacterium (ex Bugula neritina AB1)]
MAVANDIIRTDIEQYLNQHERKGLLRFITCGSVDDGKSTLIGRLLCDSKALFADQLETVRAESKKFGTQGSDLDLALIVDGLAAEREQGITIDVAYRYFNTERRKFIVADTPGHEQYTRNMITGASTADVAILLIDARKGILTQTRRHAYLASLIGIRNVVLAVNKMDLVKYSEKVFTDIVDRFNEFSSQLEYSHVTAIPMSALIGDNVIEPSVEMPWYHGTTLLSYLETVKIPTDEIQQSAFRLPVQWVNRPNLDFRGFAGTIASGSVKPGDAIRVQPTGKTSTVDRIVTYDGDLEEAVAGQAVTITLKDQIDISRGDIISTTETPASTANQFESTLVWMDEEPLLPGRSYYLKCGTATATATITDIKHEINVNTLEQTAAKKLELNNIGSCNLNLDRQLAFDTYQENQSTGSYILIDRATNHTVGAGTLNFALRRSQNIHMQAVDVDKGLRSELKEQKACVLWFTGLSGSGKSTIANIVEKKLAAKGRHTYLLDGDNVRHGLNKDLGFTDADRVENIRRIGEVARLMVDSGLIVLTAFISPFIAERQMARSLLEDGEFLEIYVETPLAIAEERDPKGLYKKARRGELKNFTGIDSPYEHPESPEILVDTSSMSAEQCAERVIAILRQRGVIQEG